MNKAISRNCIRKNRHLRIRNKINGTAERPRLCVYRSNTNIYAQIIDDTTSCTLIAASTIEESLKGKLKSSSCIEAAKEVGKLIANKAKEKGINTVVFDRSGYIYHGKIKALADAAREAGLEF